MHELGILVHMAKTVKEVAEENNLTEIGGITLEIGEVSGIVPEFLTDCWEYYRKKEEIMKNSDLKIEIMPAVTYCENCGKTYPTVEHGKQCPYCESYETYLLEGNGCNIKEIEACQCQKGRFLLNDIRKELYQVNPGTALFCMLSPYVL